MRISDWGSDVCSSDLISQINEDCLKRFGGAFHKRFNSLLTRVDRYYIKQKGFSIVSSYGSLITCRHEFAHQGSIPETASYNDIKNGYEAGKVVLSCLAKRSEEHTSELQSLMRISYADFCLK